MRRARRRRAPIRRAGDRACRSEDQAVCGVVRGAMLNGQEPGPLSASYRHGQPWCHAGSSAEWTGAGPRGSGLQMRAGAALRKLASQTGKACAHMSIHPFLPLALHPAREKPEEVPIDFAVWADPAEEVEVTQVELRDFSYKTKRRARPLPQRAAPAQPEL